MALRERWLRRDVERMVCTTCGAWIEFPRGQFNRANEEWHVPGTPEAAERDRLAAEFTPFMQRHGFGHGKDPGASVRVVRSTQWRFWCVDAAKREPLG